MKVKCYNLNFELQKGWRRNRLKLSFYFDYSGETFEAYYSWNDNDNFRIIMKGLEIVLNDEKEIKKRIIEKVKDSIRYIKKQKTLNDSDNKLRNAIKLANEKYKNIEIEVKI